MTKRFFLFSLCVFIVLSCGAARLEAQSVRPQQELIKPERPEPPLHQPENVIPDWQAWLELARLQSYVGQFDDSLASYVRVLKEKPDHLQARLERIKVLSWAGRHEEAWVELNSIPEDGLDADARLLMGDLYASRLEYDKARTIFEEHLQGKPDDSAVRLKLAEVLSWDGRYEDSLKQFSILLRDFPDDVQLRRKYAFVLSWAGKHEDAIQELRRTLP
ncbi:MAG TPA: tetratricopeptide repeat protein [Desulfonatronum sp.]|nr:tetratricopeptide repeat protein [Desulfonatronum sp.]